MNNKLGSIYYNPKSDIIIEFLNSIVKINPSDVDIFTHNINFDGILIIDSLSSNRIRFEWFIRNLDIYWIDIFFLNIKIKIRCSYKIIPLSIKKLGKILNIEKQIFPYKFSSIENLNYKGSCPDIVYFNNLTTDEYHEYALQNFYFDFKILSINYCFNDLKILTKILSELINIINEWGENILKNSFSFSSIAYKIFEKKFDRCFVCSKKLKINEYEYAKKSYFGGRCEVFGNPQNNQIIHYFDFKGMYAECMKNNFPVGKGMFKTNKLNINEIGLHCVEVFSEMSYPILPFHQNKKLLFPNGKFIGIFTHIELNYFLQNNGKILNHFSSFVFKTEEKVFKNYVEQFIQLREKGTFYKMFGKIMNNGLYGSFALNVDDEETIVVFNEEEFNAYLNNTNVVSWKKLNNCIILKILKNNLSKKFLDKKNKWTEEKRNVIYASYISSYARIKLHKGFQEILKNNGKLYYCDTDSFFAGFDKNYLNCEMGELKWSEIFDDAVFISPKFYYLKKNNLEKSAIKGINLNTHSFEKIKTNFYNNEENILFQNQLNFSKKNYELTQNYITKTLNINNYEKRIFINNKKETLPYTLTY